MNTHNGENEKPAQARNRHKRDEVAQKVLEFRQMDPKVSQRQYAKDAGISRGALRGWLARGAQLNASPEAIAFFESPAGLAVLHRLHIALFVVLTLLNPCGARAVSLVLELSGLDNFIASGYGTIYNFSKLLHEHLEQYGNSQRAKLSKTLKETLSKRGLEAMMVVLLEDETFHPDICLVAIEAFSNFIIVEQYSDKRDAQSWNKAVNKGLEDLPLEVVAVNADEAKGLKAHITKGLGVPHLCELFHVQHEITKGTSAALASKVRSQTKTVEKAVATHDKAAQKLAQAVEKTGECYVARKRLEEVDRALKVEKEALAQVEQDREQMREAVRTISTHYHPYDLQTGQERSSEQVRSEFNECFDEIEQLSASTNLPARANKCIAKARRLVESMSATVAFFHSLIASGLDGLNLEEDVRGVVRNMLIPLEYLRLAAGRASEANQRKSLIGVVESLIERVGASTVWLTLSEGEREKLLMLSREWARLFVRSDSAVEGRNGQLSLHHHGLHRLSGRKLRALTVIHNYFLRRKDGTTAAERLFGQPPDDLFDWLLLNMPLPSRPAQKRTGNNTRRAA